MDLVLDDAQTQNLTSASGPVVVRDSSGRQLGVLSLQPSNFELTSEDLEELNRRMSSDDTKWFTTEEVVQHLESLDQQ